MGNSLTRRSSLASAAGAAAGMATVSYGQNSPAAGHAIPPLSGRFVTHVSVVRVNQIEVTPTKNLGEDEVPDNSPAPHSLAARGIRARLPRRKNDLGNQLARVEGQRQQYKDARRLLVDYHDKYGDEITFIPGGYFAPMFDTREHNRETIHKALAMITDLVGNGYRPQCLVAGFMDAENQRFLAADEGIYVCQGQIWSQHGIDNGDGDGGICYPYYPSRQHYLKPAQGPADFIDCVCLDGWTCDFLTARREGFQGGFNSRLGVGPIESVGNLATDEATWR